MVGKYANHCTTLRTTLVPRPLQTSKAHDKEAFDQREKGYLTYIIKGLRILGANQQNDIITSEYLEEVHHL